jgi:hypothetical protein
MRSGLWVVFAAIALGLAYSGNALAQPHPDDDDAAVAGGADNALLEHGCELHVWPADAVRSTYSGWFHGGIVDGAVQGRDGYRKLPDSILPIEVQLRTLSELDLPALMQLPGYHVVLHDRPLPSRVIRTTVGRLEPATPDCYAELVTDDVFFQDHILDGRFLKGIFRFRQFEQGDTPTRTFGTFVQHRLLHFPPREPEQLDGALEEFRVSFGKAVQSFGEALNKPPKKRKK